MITVKQPVLVPTSKLCFFGCCRSMVRPSLSIVVTLALFIIISFQASFVSLRRPATGFVSPVDLNLALVLDLEVGEEPGKSHQGTILRLQFRRLRLNR